jgi:predicted nucleotidyltransferase component of viral defense system
VKLPSSRELSKTVDVAAAADNLSSRRVRRWVAVIALAQVFNIARTRGTIPRFIVKGGFALELRFRGEARTSRDIDIVLPLEREALMDAAIEALRIEWSGFAFRIKGTPERREHSFKFEVNSLYQNKEWSTFEVELVFGPVTTEDGVVPFNLATFGLLQPVDIPCMTAAEQIAQKLHAASDPNEDRPRDLVDIYLLDTRLRPPDTELLHHCVRTFEERATHAWPPNIDLRDGWDRQLLEMLERLELTLTLEDLLSGVRALVARLVGFTMSKNFRYHFIVLSALQSVPNLMNNAVTHDDAYGVFTRMTEQEGWRLLQMMPYPVGAPTRAILAILEQPMDGDESLSDPPRLELTLHTGTRTGNEYELMGEVRNVAPEPALAVTITVSGIDTPATIASLAREDGQRVFTLSLEGQSARLERPATPTARVRFSDRHGRAWEQIVELGSRADASNRLSYEGSGLGQPQLIR